MNYWGWGRVAKAAARRAAKQGRPVSFPGNALHFNDLHKNNPGRFKEMSGRPPDGCGAEKRLRLFF